MTLLQLSTVVTRITVDIVKAVYVENASDIDSGLDFWRGTNMIVSLSLPELTYSHFRIYILYTERDHKLKSVRE